VCTIDSETLRLLRAEERIRELERCLDGGVDCANERIAAKARIRELEAALTLLTNGFKYSTEVVTIAREALATSETKGDPNV